MESDKGNKVKLLIMKTMKKKFFSFTMLLVMVSMGMHAQEIEDKGLYELRTLGGLALDNQGSIENEATMFVSQRKAGTASQVWQLQQIEGNTYRLMNCSSFLMLDNGDGNRVQPVIQWSLDPQNKNQHWTLRKQGDGYVLICSSSQMALGLIDAAQPGMPVCQVNADSKPELITWKLVKSDVKIKTIATKNHSDNDWENPAVFAVNKLDGHPTYIPFATAEEMKEGFENSMQSIGNGFKNFGKNFVINLPYMLLLLAIVGVHAIAIAIIVAVSKKKIRKARALNAARKEALKEENKTMEAKTKDEVIKDAGEDERKTGSEESEAKITDKN